MSCLEGAFFLYLLYFNDGAYGALKDLNDGHGRESRWGDLITYACIDL